MTTAHIEQLTAELADLLDTTAGDRASAFDLFLANAQANAGRRETSADRKATIRKAIKTLDLEALVELKDKASRIVNNVTENKISVPLDEELVTALMIEFLEAREIAELIATRRDEIKAAVFAHLDDAFADEPNPSQQNGSVPAPGTGYSFVREGCGQKPPTVREDKLRKALGEERWAAVCDVVEVPEVVIPAHVECTLNTDKVIAAAQHDPEILELVRQSFVAGEWKTPRFTVKVTGEDKE